VSKSISIIVFTGLLVGFLTLPRREGPSLRPEFARFEGTLSPKRVIVEELPPIEHVVVRLRRGGAPKSVTVVPADIHIDWTFRDGWLTVNVPRVDIHRVLVVE
jgi:hypothetical protein